MRENIKHADFTRFLKDETFIEWKLFPTDELDAYWCDFLHRYPEERKNFEMAEKHFSNIRISSHTVSSEKKTEAIKRLEQSLRAYDHKRRLRHFTYAAAACAVLLILSVFYIFNDAASEEELMANSNYIVGNELESEDILFVTGNKTSSFQGNVDITIENDKTVRVRSENTEDAEISIEQDAMNKLIVPYGKRSEIILSDGSRAWLNSGSTLEFPSSFSGEKREVVLYGEMYIEVEPDKAKPFVVRTAEYDVRVYGTKFNVSSYTGVQSTVVLVEGSVGLSIDTKKEELKLSPNEQAIFYNETKSFETKEVDIEEFTSWKDGYLTFKDTPVTEVLKQIERYYNLSFEYENDISFKDKTCTGKIILSDNLDNVMTTLTLISSTKYQLIDKQIYIYK